MNIDQLKLPFTKSEERFNGRLESSTVYVVRELRTPAQDDEIINLGVEFTNDVDLTDYVEPNIVRLHCVKLRLDTERAWMNCWIAYRKEKAVGFLVGVCFPTWYNKRIVAEQKLWFVSKEHRGSKAAYLLIKAFENWARLNGATQIYTGTANQRYAEQTKYVLEKLGYRHVGSLHVKEVL
jgi:GNAT superfamily N-acetyltransferase